MCILQRNFVLCNFAVFFILLLKQYLDLLWLDLTSCNVVMFVCSAVVAVIFPLWTSLFPTVQQLTIAVHCIRVLTDCWIPTTATNVQPSMSSSAKRLWSVPFKLFQYWDMVNWWTDNRCLNMQQQMVAVTVNSFAAELILIITYHGGVSGHQGD